MHRSRRSRCCCGAVIASLVLLVLLPAPAAAQEPSASIEGGVTINGNQAAKGVKLLASSDEAECGLAVVGDQGRYSMPLSEACPPGSEMRMLLAATQDVASEELEVGEGTQTFDVAFEISEESLQTVLADAAGVAEPEPSDAQIIAEVAEGTTESLLSSRQLFGLLIALVAGASVVLTSLVLTRASEFRARMRLLESMKGESEGKVKAFSEALARDDELSSPHRRLLIEGLVLTLVVIAIVILGGSGKITKEGLVSVLAAIVGYAVGRGATR